MSTPTNKTQESTRKALGDIDNRFSIDEIPHDIVPLRQEFSQYVIDNSEGLDTTARIAIKYGVAGSGEEGPTAHSVVDTISNRKFALIGYDKIISDPEQGPDINDKASLGLMLGELKDNKVVGTPEAAARGMGLPADFTLADLPFIRATASKDFSIEEVLRDVISKEQALQSGPDINGGPAVDTRNMLASHSKREAAIDAYLESQKTLIDTSKQDLVDFNATLSADAMKDERITHFAKHTAMANEIKNQELNVLKAIVTPEKFTLDGEGKAVLVDVEDLNNRFAKTRENTTIPLGDPNGKYNIGKVSAAHIEDSPSILEGDTILSSIRVRTSGDDRADVNIYAVKNNEGQAWLRAEKVSMDGFEALDEEAFASIGIDSNKFVVGGDTSPSQVMAQITPAALQETIARRQLLNHNTWKGEPGFNNEPVKEHKASDWAYPRSSDDGWVDRSVLEVRALNKIQAQKTDNRTTVTDLSAKQIENLEEFGIIRYAQMNPTKGYEYIGGASGHVITDHLNNSVQLLGQTLVNTDRNSGVGEPKVETVDFDIAIRPDRPDRIGIQHPVNGSSQGTISVNIHSAAYQEAHGHDWELAGGAMRADFKGQAVLDTDSTRYTGKNIVEALAASPDILYSDDPKMHNNFGRGIKHESVVSLERATALRTGYDEKMEAVNNVEAPSISRAKP